MSDEVDKFYAAVIDGNEGDGVRFWNFWQSDRKSTEIPSLLLSNFNTDKATVARHTARQKNADAAACINLYWKIDLLSNLAAGLMQYPQLFDEQMIIPTQDNVVAWDSLQKKVRVGELHADLIARMTKVSTATNKMRSRVMSYENGHLKSSVEGFLIDPVGWSPIVQENIGQLQATIEEQQASVRAIGEALSEQGSLDEYQTRVLRVTDYMNCTIYPELHALCKQLSHKTLAPTQASMSAAEPPVHHRREPLSEADIASVLQTLRRGFSDPAGAKPPLSLAVPAQSQENSATVHQNPDDWEDFYADEGRSARAADTHESWHPVQETPPTKGVQFPDGVGEPTPPAIQNGASVIPLKFSGAPKKSITTDGAEPAGVIDLVARLAERKPNGNLTGL